MIESQLAISAPNIRGQVIKRDLHIKMATQTRIEMWDSFRFLRKLINPSPHGLSAESSGAPVLWCCHEGSGNTGLREPCVVNEVICQRVDRTLMICDG